MSIIIQKYGGTSVGSIDKILSVAKIISHSLVGDKKIVVVVSAMSGKTDELFNLAKQINPHITTGREIDSLVATGEQITVSLLTLALQNLGVKASSFCGWQIPIITTHKFTNARIHNIDANKIIHIFKTQDVIIVAGFQGVTDTGDITTLGRGGSDISAVAIAASIKADECQIYTDVNGVYTADPNKISGAHRIHKINGVMMFEAASLGAKVLHVRSCELAYRYKINIRVISTFAPHDQGSLIVNKEHLEDYPVADILATEDNQSLFQITHTNNNITPQHFPSNKLIAKLYEVSNLDMLNTQQNYISFAAHSTHQQVISNFLTLNNIKFNTINNLTKLSIVGSGFRSNQSLNQKIWNRLMEFEIFATTHNEISFSILIHALDVIKVRNSLSHLL